MRGGQGVPPVPVTVAGGLAWLPDSPVTRHAGRVTAIWWPVVSLGARSIAAMIAAMMTVTAVAAISCHHCRRLSGRSFSWVRCPGAGVWPAGRSSRGPNPGMKSGSEPALPASAGCICDGLPAAGFDDAPLGRCIRSLPGAERALAAGCVASAASGADCAPLRLPATDCSSRSASAASGRTLGSLQSNALISGHSGPAWLGGST